jgi:hypothetical protein
MVNASSTKAELFAEVVRLRTQLVDQYVKSELEIVALHERIAELEAGIKAVAPLIKRGAALEEENADLTAKVVLVDEKLVDLLPRLEQTFEAARNPQKALASKRKGKVSTKKDYRKLVLGNERLKRDLWVADDPVSLVIQYCKSHGIGYPAMRQTIKRWLVKIGLVPTNT